MKENKPSTIKVVITIKINTGRRVLILRGSYLYNLNNELPDLKGVGILWGLR